MNNTTSSVNSPINVGIVLCLAVGFICIVVWLVFRSTGRLDELTEPVDIVRVATNKAAIEQCRDQTKCSGGFIKFRGIMPIYRITVGQSGDGSWTVGAAGLVQNMQLNGDAYLDRIQDIVLPSEPRWDDFMKRHAKQFVTVK